MTGPTVEVSGEEARAQPPRTGRPNFDLIIAVSAIVMSAISLFVAIENGISQRELVAADTWPFPRAILSNGYNEQNDIAIGSLEWRRRAGEDQDLRTLLQGAAGVVRRRPAAQMLRTASGQQGFAFQLFRRGRNRPASRRIQSRAADISRIARAGRRQPVGRRTLTGWTISSFRVCYCSVLDECWISDLKSTKTTAVRMSNAARARAQSSTRTGDEASGDRPPSRCGC